MNPSVLRRHFEAYPAMQPRDALKLCYQSTFGVEHLLSDQERALSYLRQELENTQPCPPEPPYEDIGGGYARLNLKAPAVRCLSPEDIFRMMRKSVGVFSRSMEDCFQALQMVEELARSREAPFSLPAFREEVERFRQNGCQAVHHSEIYRKVYAPAYRVMMRDCALMLLRLPH